MRAVRPVLSVLSLLSLFLVCGTVAGCAPETRVGEGVDWVGEIGPESFEGMVRVVGSEPFPFTIVQAEDGRSRIVTGVFRDEVRRLAGAQVRVTGRLVQGEQPGTALEASSYELVSVDGERPLLGRLERDVDGFHLARPGGRVTRLDSVSGQLARRVGSLIWVVLDERGGVSGYGVIRDPEGEGAA
ncbi:hypothetical protein [Candidatus Palauibacter sp.]|uniref:hypothetical protein n=1 Tax=Candidatus Palauibacter sp. TaxID=3101350 RepID=UPI003AF28F50